MKKEIKIELSIIFSLLLTYFFIEVQNTMTFKDTIMVGQEIRKMLEKEISNNNELDVYIKYRSFSASKKIEEYKINGIQFTLYKRLIFLEESAEEYISYCLEFEFNKEIKSFNPFWFIYIQKGLKGRILTVSDFMYSTDYAQSYSCSKQYENIDNYHNGY